MRKNIRIVSIIIALSMMITFLSIAPMQAQGNTKIKVGDYVRFGSYYGDTILWRVIHIDKDGDPLLFAENILTLKAFDAGGNYHSHNLDKAYGSNDWEGSNIRQWLNSSDESIKWIQNPPNASNTSDNAYDKEKGFLAQGNFTIEDRNAIKTVTNKVLLADNKMSKRDGGTEAYKNHRDIEEAVKNYDRAYYKNYDDRVFLLSVKELKEYVYDRGWEHRAKPTAKAVANSDYKDSDLSTGKYFDYWLRTPAYTFYLLYCDTVGDVPFGSTYFGSNGIRPALYLDMSSSIFKSGTGTSNNPYLVTGVEKPVEVNKPEIFVSLNNLPITFDVKPQSINNRTMVPLRGIFEALGLEVGWDPVTRKITGTKDGLKIEAWVDRSEAFVNGKSIALDVPPAVVDNRTLVPVRFIAEATGADVQWNGELNTVLIKTK